MFENCRPIEAGKIIKLLDYLIVMVDVKYFLVLVWKIAGNNVYHRCVTV